MMPGRRRPSVTDEITTESSNKTNISPYNPPTEFDCSINLNRRKFNLRNVSLPNINDKLISSDSVMSQTRSLALAGNRWICTVDCFPQAEKTVECEFRISSIKSVEWAQLENRL